jgi:hypothetical protein
MDSAIIDWSGRAEISNTQGINWYPGFGGGTSAAVPVVVTRSISSITGTSAIGRGTVSSDGGSAITERGVCWNTSSNPTTSNSKATATGTLGDYTANIAGLTIGETYHVRAYAINGKGTSYGEDISFVAAVGGQSPKPSKYHRRYRIDTIH